MLYILAPRAYDIIGVILLRFTPLMKLRGIQLEAVRKKAEKITSLHDKQNPFIKK